MQTRPGSGQTDAERMLALAYATAADQPHLLDLPYRLCSPALYDNPTADTQLWEDAAGNLLAFAVWQVPFVTLDYAIHPAAPGNLPDAVMTWATTRFAVIGRERGVRLPYWCEARPDQEERRGLFLRHGFTPAPTWQRLHLTQSLDHTIPAPALPVGFTVRPLAGANEVAAYVATHQAAFASTSMTTAWRVRTLAAPGYRPDLDLVIIAPDGRLAACCIVWVTPKVFAEERAMVGQIEPLSVHPDFHRRGLGRAILLAALQRLQAIGALSAAVDVYTDNPVAQQLYESVGFRSAHLYEKWRRDF